MKTPKKAKLGCFINDTYYGTIFYTDNIVFIGASVRKLGSSYDRRVLYVL